jgi:hypothetical protein
MWFLFSSDGITSKVLRIYACSVENSISTRYVVCIVTRMWLDNRQPFLAGTKDSFLEKRIQTGSALQPSLFCSGVLGDSSAVLKRPRHKACPLHIVKLWMRGAIPSLIRLYGMHMDKFFTCTQCHRKTQVDRSSSSRIRMELRGCCCSKALYKPVWHIPLLSVRWITPDDGQRNCPKHIEFHFQNKFEKLVHLVGFIIRKQVDK